MAYRTYVNDIQVFGNNEAYPEWIEFLERQGVAVDGEWEYEGKITDFMGAVEACEAIALRLERERQEHIANRAASHSMFDLSDIPKKLQGQEPENPLNESLLDILLDVTKNYYAFLPYTLYMACRDLLEPRDPFAVPGHFYCWKLKDGCAIPVSAG